MVSESRAIFELQTAFYEAILYYLMRYTYQRLSYLLIFQRLLILHD